MAGRSITSGADIEPGIIQRVAGALQLIVTGKTPDWFGPSNLLDPVAPDAAVRGRAFDYPTAYNLALKPKSNDSSNVSYQDLRLLADNYDILRLVIETRKDQIGKVPWSIVNKAEKQDETAKALEAFFAFPDGEHDFHTWLRMLIEDLLVIDAPTVYVNRGDKVPRFEVIDGATIKPALDETGRRPKYPAAAYQQNLKGVPAINYSDREIVYRPRNPRSFKTYGLSPVEQIVNTVNVGLRRVTQQLEHFRSGSIPQMLVGVPETWNPSTIGEFQRLWDELHQGNLRANAGLSFIPGNTEVHDLKGESIVKNDFDEWLARIVCFAFSVPASPFVRDMNRATAESAAEQGKSEGLAPLLQWAKQFIDELIQKHIGATAYEFKWDFSALENTKDKVERVIALKTAGIISTETAQKLVGVEVHEVAAPAKVAPVEKMAKADQTDPDLTPEEAALGEKIKPFLDQAGEKAVKSAKDAVEKGKPLSADLMTEKDRKRFVKAMLPTIKAAALAGVSKGASQLAGQEDLPNPLDVEAPAAMWARERSAWMVGMKWVDGVLMPNPNATYRIDEMMRDALRSQVATAIEEGWTSVKLGEAIRGHNAFSWHRANNIARTEIAEAQEEGQMVYYRASGVVGQKKWSTSGGDTCPRCVGNADAGAIPLTASFPSGHLHPPAHGHCRCSTIPVVKEGIL